MSMYNIMHGRNRLEPILLGAILMDDGFIIPRYRDVFLSEDGTEVVILARVGGGNRSSYLDQWDDIRARLLYVRDYDDEFDSTYAWIVFRVPEDRLYQTKPYAGKPLPTSLRDMTNNVVAELQKLSPEQLREDPRTKPLVEALESITSGKNKIVEI